jgi:hypothetical protein
VATLETSRRVAPISPPDLHMKIPSFRVSVKPGSLATIAG